MDWLNDLWDAANPLNWINEFFCKSLVSVAGWFFNIYFSIVGEVNGSTFFTGSFTKLFNGQETVWNIVSGVHQSAVIPLAESILALFMLVQLIKISQRIDATATLPAVKDIVFLAVMYVIMHWLIVNSLDLATAVYDEFNNIAKLIDGNANIDMGSISSSIDFDSLDYSNASIGGCFMLVIFALLSAGVGLIAYLVSLYAVLARSIQLYIMAAFSPIPLSLLGFDATRQMGIGFIKNFCAAALAGAIMLFIMNAYPAIMTALMATEGLSYTELVNPFLGAMDSLSISAIETLLTFMATSLLLIAGLVKSGTWAKEVLGG